MPKGFLDILTEAAGKWKWKKKSEQAISAVAWPSLYALRISTEKELQLSRKLEKTKEILLLDRAVQRACSATSDLMSKKMQQEEHIVVTACKIAKIQGDRLPLSKVRTVISQQNWDSKRCDPWDNDLSEDEDVIIEEEKEAQPLIQTKIQATREPGDNWQEIPTGPQTTVPEYSSAELIELTSRFNQKSREGIAAWMPHLWNTGGDGIMLNGSEMSKTALVILQLGLWQRFYVAEGA